MYSSRPSLVPNDRRHDLHGFKNAREWLQLFQIVADIRMGAERLKPRIVGEDAPGRRIHRTAEATPEPTAFTEQLAEPVEHLVRPVKGGDNGSDSIVGCLEQAEAGVTSLCPVDEPDFVARDTPC